MTEVRTPTGFLLVVAAVFLYSPIVQAATADSILANKKAQAAPAKISPHGAEQVFVCYKRACRNSVIWLLPAIRCTGGERRAGKACCNARTQLTSERC